MSEISLDLYNNEHLQEDWIYPLLLMVYAFCLAHALSIVQLENYSQFKENCLSALYLMTPFLFFLLCKTADIFSKECLLYCIQKEENHIFSHLSFSRAMAAGVLSFWLVFLPLHRSLVTRLRALPKN